jgi:predicted nucleotidyltransferase
MKDRLNKDFLEFIALLEEKGVEYLIVGGYAVGLHGFPRYTGDIDFFVAVTEPNARRLIAVFEAFGFGDIGLQAEDFLQPDFVVEIGREPRKIQVLTGIDGVEFGECNERRTEIDYEGLRMKFIGLPELLRNKEATGRNKDRIDIEALTGDNREPEPRQSPPFQIDNQDEKWDHPTE